MPDATARAVGPVSGSVLRRTRLADRRRAPARVAAWAGARAPTIDRTCVNKALYMAGGGREIMYNFLRQSGSTNLWSFERDMPPVVRRVSYPLVRRAGEPARRAHRSQSTIRDANELVGGLFSRPFRFAVQFLNRARRAQEGAAAPFFLAAFSSFFLALSSALAP